MKNIIDIYEGVLSDIDDTLENADIAINILGELKSFQKVKLNAHKDRQTVVWECPKLLDKYLDNRLKVKFFRHETPTEIEFLCIDDPNAEEYQMRVYINNEKHKMRLACLSNWFIREKYEYSIADMQKLLELCCKSEEHFKTLLKLFNTNYVQPDGKAPSFSLSLMKQSLNKL